MKRWIAVFLFFFIFPWVLLAEDKQVVMTFVGDCTLGGEDRVRKLETSFDSYAARNGYTYFFEKVQSVIGQDDLTVANLESVLLNASTNVQKKTYNFRGPKDFVNILLQSSVEVVNVANNHIEDFGANGAKVTSQTLDAAGQRWFGTDGTLRKTCICTCQGISFGFIGVCPGYYWKHKQIIEKQMEYLREKSDVIIAVMHGGTEYAPRRDLRQEKMAQAYIKMGADLVIGHHPHVLQGIDVIDGRTICYSLGNFVFGGNAMIRAPYTALFQFTFSFDGENRYLGHQLNIIPALPSGERDFNNYQPVLATGEDAEAVMKQIQTDTPFQLNPYVENVGAVQEFVPAPEEEQAQ